VVTTSREIEKPTNRTYVEKTLAVTQLVNRPSLYFFQLAVNHEEIGIHRLTGGAGLGVTGVDSPVQPLVSCPLVSGRRSEAAPNMFFTWGRQCGVSSREAIDLDREFPSTICGFNTSQGINSSNNGTAFHFEFDQSTSYAPFVHFRRSQMFVLLHKVFIVLRVDWHHYPKLFGYGSARNTETITGTTYRRTIFRALREHDRLLPAHSP
jgi:hypothetical protein